MKEKLAKYTMKMEEMQEQQRLKRIREEEAREDLEVRPSKRKMSKFDSLKPISNYLETLMVSHGLSQSKADLLVLDITERFVTAGFGWDKVLQYHGKVTKKYSLICYPAFHRARMSSSRSLFRMCSCQRTNSHPA